MRIKKLLQINSSGRYDDSITRQVSDRVVQYLQSQGVSKERVSRDVAPGLPLVNEAWINANFTAANDRTAEQEKVLDFSNALVDELENTDYLVIASPIYNFNIPASLKIWVDLIARVGRTFRYTENGPEGMMENKKAILVMASGGVPIGSEMDMATPYLKHVLGFIGIRDVTVVDANTIDLSGDHSASQIAAILA